MTRISSVFFVGLIACGGPKPTATTTPLPPDNASATGSGSAEVVHVDPKPAPPAPMAPLDLPIPAPATTLKLVKAGSGKKAVLKLVAEKGAKQHVELALDFSGKQTAAPELGGTHEDAAPTLVLASDVEVADVGADGKATFTLTVGGVDARDRPGAKFTATEFRDQMGGIAGLTIGGSVGANGELGTMTLHLDKPDKKSVDAIALVKLSMMPMWPQLPTDPIGVGAKWTVTSPYKIAEKLDSTQTVEYELISHKGNAWEIKGTVKLAGGDQKVNESTVLEKIAGVGTIKMTLAEGAFLPASSSTLASDFTATATAPAGAGSTAGQKQSAQFHLEQGFAVSPK